MAAGPRQFPKNPYDTVYHQDVEPTVVTAGSLILAEHFPNVTPGTLIRGIHTNFDTVINTYDSTPGSHVPVVQFATFLTVELWGAGGHGGSGGSRRSGQGGGGGAYVKFTVAVSDLPKVVIDSVIHISAPTVGAPSVAGPDLVAGSTRMFGAVAGGGHNGGYYREALPRRSGGSFSNSELSVPIVTGSWTAERGGNGGLGSTAGGRPGDSAIYAGGGGGGGGEQGGYGPGPAGLSTYGGRGGQGSWPNTNNGESGVAPGGGGGGPGTGTWGKPGAAGRARLTWFRPK